jgi:hypothetical protein
MSYQKRFHRLYYSKFKFKKNLNFYNLKKLVNLRFMSQIVAIDYGKARCGIAATDDLQIIASALTT